MTSLIDRTDFGPDGLRARPTVPPSARLDDVTVRLRVDPVRQTWVALTLDGDDDSPYKTMLLVDGEQASYRETGDPEPIDIATRSPVFTPSSVSAFAARQTSSLSAAYVIVRVSPSGSPTQW